MKKTLILCILVLSWFSFQDTIYASPKHDLGARRTIRYLRKISKQERPLFGHQDDLLYGHSFQTPKDASHYDKSDVYEVCADYPALLGLDLGRTEVADMNLDYQYTSNIINAAIAHYNRGGMVTISWHCDNPVTKKDAWDLTEPRTVSLILNDEETKSYFYSCLSRIADIIEQLKDSKGYLIPIIFRPFHEDNCGFWWSNKITSNEDYKALWRLTYNYMVKERKLLNLIWAYSPYNIRSIEQYELRYPGDDFVDIICNERYQVGISSRDFVDQVHEGLTTLIAFAKKHKKIAALSECGIKSVAEDNWWTEVLIPAIKGYRIAYALVWRNGQNSTEFYAPYRGHKTEDNFKYLYDSKSFLFLSEIKR